MSKGNILVLSSDILKRIDLYLEEIYEVDKKAEPEKNIAKKMVDLKLKTTQVRSLQTLANSASRFSEIINYIKNQAGKDNNNQWIIVGPLLLNKLDLLEKEARNIAGNRFSEILEVKLRLARQWIKQVVVNYLYLKNLEKDNKK
ncbi:hypothetical protein MHK_000782 [Candidatus Magnetomorum sp. HK-1]|nr:hypothetical protein MHK_000782 [Candidatus Magnetomorum sp. HK-1]